MAKNSRNYKVLPVSEFNEWVTDLDAHPTIKHRGEAEHMAKERANLDKEDQVVVREMDDKERWERIAVFPHGDACGDYVAAVGGCSMCGRSRHAHVTAVMEQYGGPDPREEPEWWADTSNYDGDLVDLF